MASRLGNDKEAISAAFDAGIDDHKTNLLFGSSGIVSRTLDHWRGLLDDAFKLIESLRADCRCTKDFARGRRLCAGGTNEACARFVKMKSRWPLTLLILQIIPHSYSQ